jgi:hypothetical protein
VLLSQCRKRAGLLMSVARRRGLQYELDSRKEALTLTGFCSAMMDGRKKKR